MSDNRPDGLPTAAAPPTDTGACDRPGGRRDGRNPAGKTLSSTDGSFRAHFLDAPIAYLLTDAQWRVVEANWCAAALFGASRSALVGQSFASLVDCSPAAAPWASEGRPGAVDSNGELTGVVRLASGGSKEVRIRAASIGDGQNGGSGHRIVVIPRERAEDDPRSGAAGMAGFRELVEALRVVPWEADARTWRFTYVGPQAEQLLGYPVEAWYEPDFWVRHLHPEDREAAVAYCQRHSAEGRGHEFEYRMIRADGESVWVRDMVSAASDARGTRLLRGVMLDITDRKRGEQERSRAHDELERRVLERTEALLAANRRLEAEIAERKRAEEALLHYASIIRSTTDAVIGETLDGVIVSWNAGAERLYGYRAEEMIGKPVSLLTPSDRQAEPQQLLERLRAGEAIERLETVRVRKDGQAIDVSVSAAPIRDGAGEIVGASIIARDITERKQSEEALRQNRELLKSLIDNTTAIIYVKRPDGRYLLINRQYEKLFHVSAETIQGKTDYDIFPRPIADAFRANDLRALEARAAIQLEEYAPLPDGLHTYVSVKFPLLAENGEPYAVCGISSDITERIQAEAALRESEERFRRLADAAFEAIIVHEKGWIIDANARAARLFAGEVADLLQKNLWSLVVPELLKGADVSAEDLSERVVAARGKRLDGENFHAEVMSRRLPYGGREVWVTAVRDVTERALAEQERRRREFELAHAARYYTVGEMAATLAHELNQPLTAITAFARGALRRLSSSTLTTRDLNGALNQIAAQALHAGAIVRSLRDFVRTHQPNRTAVRIHQTVEEAVRLAQPEARYRGAWIRLEPAEDLPGVMADKVQIGQVVLNLLRNAVEALGQVPPERREIVVRTRHSEPGYVEVSVQDQGRGVPESEQECIFRPFYTTRADGMGMGLSISRSIVRAHGGRIWFESTPGSGTTFHFTLAVDGRATDVNQDTDRLRG